jgi:hypothetical protein
MTIGYGAQARLAGNSDATFQYFAVEVLAKVTDERIAEKVCRQYKWSMKGGVFFFDWFHESPQSNTNLFYSSLEYDA